MKKAIVTVLLVLILSCLYAEKSAVPYVSLDGSSIDFLWNDCLQTRIDLGVNFSSGFGISFPLTLLSDTTYSDVTLLDFGLFLNYRPFSDGFFVSVSLFQMGMYFGLDKPAQGNPYLNEVAFGYTWHVSSHLFLEPKLLIRDPSGVFQNEYDIISGVFPDYAPVRFSVSLGWDFLAAPVPETGGEESMRQEGETVQ
ncbi:hypothetical protein SpiGrapes_2487 [Sphaerochaeta pleomorpha str. Grapes]|uniref:Outer membrane protein beta-barrel domain-containing protein n=1 Tax=Sphaerochaeta pleomorpha (strain ATCC BAA-1885 / DSM 22778 / Grapes) TaxID=158190 RepID=G8QU01_SPHPG|nr:hypothetical protein [Sphaerochaeta pleomorpha]AEV30248.1 hypothetical protein SpiGrapes_2487 [Sphaerochaeta pleomorpha str. Grapes]